MPSIIETEILIIGAGIAGTSLAYHLACYGHDVALLERSTVASEASGVGAGTLWATGYGTHPDLMSTLAMGSQELFKMLQFERGYDIEYRQSGTLRVAQTEEQAAFLRTMVTEMQARGQRVEILDIRDAQTLEPELSPALAGCMFYPLGGSANTQKTAHAFVSEALKHGAHLYTHHEVTGIKPLDSGSYEVLTPQRTFRAKMVVLAAGPWCRSLGEMLDINIPVFPVRTQMWSTGPIPTRLFHVIGATESTLYWHKEPGSTTPRELTHHEDTRLTRHLYGRQTRDGEVIFGGDRQLSSEKAPQQAGIDVNRNYAIELFPFLRAFPIKRSWSGWMPLTPLLEPLIGNVSLHKHLYVLTGVYVGGFEHGPMAAKLLADFIHYAEQPPLLATANPARQGL